jgi:hypothetical protein
MWHADAGASGMSVPRLPCATIESRTEVGQGETPNAFSAQFYNYVVHGPEQDFSAVLFFALG